MTKDEILSRLLSDISDEFDKDVGSFFYDVTKPASEEFETAYARLEEILKNGFALTATGEYLDCKAAEQGITRKSGVASQVKVTITGAPGSVISVGDKVASDSLVFSSIENVEIGESGTADVTVICDTVGTVGNIPQGAINRFPVTLSGIVSVTNKKSATGGFNEETDDELRDRYFEKVSLPATSGSKYHYEQWAKEISGVGDAKCLPLWNGSGTVKVIIINSEKGVASEELISEVANHIEENRPIGAEVTVESAAPLTINVSAKLTLANGTAIKTPGLAFKVLSDGSVHADKEYTSPCADYAEYFEWADGNPKNEDRAGYFVKLKDGKIVLCEDFDTPLGIVSATPAIIGDSGEMHWQGKFLTDDFGRIQYHDVTVPAEIDEDGNIVTEEHIETQPILNPDWNPEQEYIPRKDRPEWSAVGVLGKLIVYNDGTLQSGDICRCGANGKAAKSINDGYTVLKRVSDDKVLIWFKG